MANSFRIPYSRLFDVAEKNSGEGSRWLFECRRCEAVVPGGRRTDHLRKEHPRIFKRFEEQGKEYAQRVLRYRQKDPRKAYKIVDIARTDEGTTIRVASLDAIPLRKHDAPNPGVAVVNGNHVHLDVGQLIVLYKKASTGKWHADIGMDGGDAPVFTSDAAIAGSY